MHLYYKPSTAFEIMALLAKDVLHLFDYVLTKTQQLN